MHQRTWPLMSVATALAAFGCLSLAACDPWKDPPVRFEAPLALEPGSGGAEGRAELAAHIAHYLGVDGLTAADVRIATGATADTYLFRVVGTEALPAPLLRAVSARVAGLDSEFAWNASAEVAEEGGDAGATQASAQRLVPVPLDWRRAHLDPYLVPEAAPEPALARAAGGRRRIVCMLEFSSSVAGLPAQAVAVAQPLLQESFAPPEFIDGKVMFRAGVVETAGILDLGSPDSPAAYDVDGAARRLCEEELGRQNPAVSAMLKKAAPLRGVKWIGPGRVMPPAGA